MAGPPGHPRPTARCGCRSEEHTSELQSHSDLVCRLLLEKKKKKKSRRIIVAVSSSHINVMKLEETLRWHDVRELSRRCKTPYVNRLRLVTRKSALTV